ncbi:MAG: NAD(+) diphosphatase [Anaerovoracaceae bacterium]|jgi:NAD+ diphosphatase
MIQDIAPHRFHNEFRCESPEPEDRVIHFSGKNILVRKERGSEPFPTLSMLGQGIETIYLFSIDDHPYFLALDDEVRIPEGFEYRNVKWYRFKAEGPKHQVFAAVTAYQLNNWYRGNRYCGTCGARMEVYHGAREIHCPDCGKIIYPRIVPAVIVGVLNGDRILLTRYLNSGGYQNHALIAGFTEIGETLEETVRREVMEETGIRVKNIRYYKSQPWGIVDDLLAGFYCDLDGDPTIRLQRDELKEGIWCPRDEVPDTPDDVSLTNEMILRFKEGKENVG